jgi:hypothetical protein
MIQSHDLDQSSEIVRGLFTDISLIADELQSGPRAKDFVRILGCVFRMHVPRTDASESVVSPSHLSDTTRSLLSRFRWLQSPRPAST